ncbi:MAG TPA: ribosome silencing factor [Polyangia bacterium]|nr:ribosome silencing factor [Polyangia bacterium]
MTKTRRPAKSTSRAKNPGRAASDGRKRGEKTGGSNPSRPSRGGAGKTAKEAAKGGGSRGGGGVRAKPAAAAAAPSPASAKQLDEARELALAAIEAALEKKALMPVLIDVSAMASYTDFIGIVSGRSDRQVEAIADAVSQFMKSRGRRVIGHEGSGNGRWTLLDYGEIVIHVFYHPVREFYDLESLWIDAPRVKMAIPPEAILTQSDALYGAL